MSKGTACGLVEIRCFFHSSPVGILASFLVWAKYQLALIYSFAVFRLKAKDQCFSGVRILEEPFEQMSVLVCVLLVGGNCLVCEDLDYALE